MNDRGAPAPSNGARVGALRLALCLAALLAWGAVAAGRGLVAGDPALPSAAVPAFEAAVAAADAAAASPLPWSPDATAWRPALSAVRAAVAAAPGHPAPLRLQLRAYALVGWWVRAAATIDDLVDATMAVDPTATDPWDDAGEPVPAGPPTGELVARTFAELGFARYQAGALDAALEVYERWSALAPDEPEAIRWIGRIWLERGDPVTALPFWVRLDELLPDDDTVAFFLAGARLGAEVGPVAGAAFRQGVARYEAGDLEGAAASFETARTAAPQFADAQAWAGRVALESGRPAEALARYRDAAALRPADGGIAFFVRLAQAQVDFGVAAGRALFAGFTAYEAGDAAAAASSFEAAAAANAAYAEAWAWLGRVRQEQGRFAEAEAAWARVVALDPGDERARGFLNLAREQQAYQGAAGSGTAADFAAGVAAFERADFTEALTRFVRAVEADPTSGLGWTWLGRVAYAVRDFTTAADALGRARTLLPDDEDVAWFAEDAAARLAEEAEP